ncbi:MAG: GspH/FimT family pseudopilin [Methyloligellaceae bacterium]
MSPAGEAHRRSGVSGFTLLELLMGIAILALAAGAVLVVPRSGSGSAALRSAAHETAARLREARALAINHGRPKAVLVDLGRRIIAIGHGRKPLKIAGDIRLTITAAASERQSRQISGVRFFPNGSSTGATLRFARDRQAFEVRVNWLTGRVSINAAR